MHAKKEGYMTGVNADHFNPGAYLQRQDFALALMRHYMSKGKAVTEKEDETSLFFITLSIVSNQEK